MRITRNVTWVCLLVVWLLSIAGCAKKETKIDENRPIDEVKAEAEKMDAKELRAAALKYKEVLAQARGAMRAGRFTPEEEELYQKSQNDNIGRVHIAKLIVEKGFSKDFQTAFNNYLKDEDFIETRYRVFGKCW